ncbi:hypothetical protein MMC13_002306 [Lambiella insularis]|nr:hypothetical protein [Lambiella insularis]
MSKENVSSMGKWTELEKYQVFFAMLDAAGGKTDWSKVVLPEGRSIKAAQCMVDVCKKQAGVPQALRAPISLASTLNKGKGGIKRKRGKAQSDEVLVEDEAALDDNCGTGLKFGLGVEDGIVTQNERECVEKTKPVKKAKIAKKAKKEPVDEEVSKATGEIVERA